MAPAQVAAPALATSISRNISSQKSMRDTKAVLNECDIKTVDALVRHRAQTNPHATIVSYPFSGIEFIDYTMQQLDVFAYRTARHYQKWIPARESSGTKPTTVALLGPSNFDYMITMLALAKMGHTVLFLSTRISLLAIESLIESTGATHLLVDSRFTKVAAAVNKNMTYLKVNGIAERGTYDFPIEVHADTSMDSQLDPDIETLNNVFIIHSSGSTGLPKPIYQPNKNTIANYAFSMNMKAFITLPLYHNHGICNFFRAIYSGKSIHIYNADLPLTQPYLTSIFREHKFQIFYGVPYALKLLSESDEGIQLLKELEIVMFGGSACPDVLGNLLVEKGVNLVGHYGATEVGQLMTSFRPAGDNAWNYVREGDSLKPFLRWVRQGPNLFECTVTDGWPSKVASNRPDGSYATKDLFEPHPTIPSAWKYIARLDDTIVLVNGEKFNPVMMEGTIRSHKAVAETTVFGSGRPYLGVLVVPSSNVADLSDDDIIDQIFPLIEEANKTSEAYARISRDMIKVLPHECQFPRTDKGSIIRQAFYKQFEKEINDAYDQAETSSRDLKVLSLPELEVYVRDLVTKSIPDAEDLDSNVDFFSIGLDSLQSIQMRTELLKNIDIGSAKLGQNVVFEHPSVASLSAHLFSLRTGQVEENITAENEIHSLIEKYGSFNRRQRKHSIVVTGATGSLGAHVVAQLLSRPDIALVYCLVRAQNSEYASSRIRQSLIQRKLYHTLPLSARRKIVPIPSDLSDPQLGLSADTYNTITSNLRSVIHCAWSVNFNLSLSSFEKDSIAGVRHLIDLCHAVPGEQHASFDFCSSVSTVVRCPQIHTPEMISEASWAQNMGYAQSKHVAEQLCVKAAEATGIRARVLRVGQIVADTVHGVWNATEGIPLIMQTALTVGALPKLQETPSWTPVDVVARAVCDISLSDAGAVVANVTNPKTFDWTKDLLPALRNAGLSFDEVEPKEWVRRLRESSQDPTINPPIKLVDFFASKYDRDTFTPSRTYDTSVACSLSPSLANAPLLDTDFVATFVKQFQTTAWQGPSIASPLKEHKQAVFLAGPYGSSNVTLGKAISSRLYAPLIDADNLHTSDVVAQMCKGDAIPHADFVTWLERVKRRVLETLDDLGYRTVIIACSKLKRANRDQLRGLRNSGIDLRFVDLQLDQKELQEIAVASTNFDKSTKIIDSNVSVTEWPDAYETDVLPVDAECGEEAILKDIENIINAVV